MKIMMKDWKVSRATLSDLAGTTAHNKWCVVEEACKRCRYNVFAMSSR